MFYDGAMQVAFSFAGADIASWRTRLGSVAVPRRRRSPVGQLIKSIISARTRDAVSAAAYDRLVDSYADPFALARANPAAVAQTIGGVTFADVKAAQLVAALRRIAAADGGPSTGSGQAFALCQLAELPLGDALAWLERLPGVARKVSASTLNASTLRRPVMIVDTHVLRVLQRLGFVPRAADYRAASEAVTAAMPDWTGDDFLGFHIALKRLGQIVCRWDVPDCAICPLAADCPVGRGRSGT